MQHVSDPQWERVLVDFLRGVERPLVVVLGPTASGKTDFSIALCHFLQEQGRHPEVVNADSRQLYRYLDIGTAKITEAERGNIHHHLIDVLDPKEEATAGWYQGEAERVIDEILRREGVPVLVGGSMLYVSSIIDDLRMAPVPDAELRQHLMNEYDMDKGVTLHRKLQSIDPQAAEQIHRNNKPRLVRALEIFALTKRPKSQAVPRSELRAGAACHGSTLLTMTRFSYDLLIFGLMRPREELYRRIADRIRAMFSAGWMEEVQRLLDRGYTRGDPGMKSHGYREIMERMQMVQRSQRKQRIDARVVEAVRSDTSLVEGIAAKARQYAKRQETWWRNDKRIHWITAAQRAYRNL